MPRVRQVLWHARGAISALILALTTVSVAVHSQDRLARSDGLRVSGTVYSIDLPFEEPPQVPPGPNVAQFTAYCRLCHSPKLVLTQPRFPEKKWGEIVRKMVTVYGAQIPPDQEPLVVDYLKTVLGPETPAPK